MNKVLLKDLLDGGGNCLLLKQAIGDFYTN